MAIQWDMMRLLRASIAGWAFWQAFSTGEWILLLPGGILALQAIFNVGCCGSAGCAVPTARGNTADPEITAYEEVK